MAKRRNDKLAARIKCLNLFTIIAAIIIAAIFFINSCNVDFLGLVYSSDLDERLKSKNVFHFLTEEDRFTSFGSNYSFIVLADTHIENGKTWGFEGLKDVITDHGNIKFVVVMGDITQYGASLDIDKFIEVAGSFGVPCYPVVGNHDIYFNNWSVYKEKIGSTRYKIDGNGTTLFILDTANSFIGKEQLDWLESEVNAANGRVFIFTHSPLFVTGPADMQQITDVKERARIVSMLKNRCDVMFMGHSHKRYFNEAGNVRYQAIEDFKGTKTYCIVTVNGSDVTYKFEKL